MTTERDPLNPFRVPSIGPKVSLRPWKFPEHKDYYVDVGNTQDAFDEFTRRMDTETLQRDGQLVLVAGESGCGKTALINRCAWHVCERLRADRVDMYVVDLHQCLVGVQVAGDERFAYVQQSLIAELEGEGMLLPTARDTVRGYDSNPKAIYRILHNLLRERTVLIVLLPPSDLPEHVIAYGAQRFPRVLFLAEFDYATYAEEHVSRIEAALEATTPPIVLRLHGLKPGDLRRFSTDRLRRHRQRGIYPRMADDIFEALDESLPTVKVMHSLLYDLYEDRMTNGLSYDESSVVDLKAVARTAVNIYGSSARRQA